MFDNFEKVLFRNPIFPISTLFDENGETKNLDSFAKEFLKNEVFLEAVFWSSPTFYKILLNFKKGEIKDKKKQYRILNSLKKYIIRSATRPTPFGTFAGVSLASIHATSQDTYSKRKLRLDISILSKIKASIETHPEFSQFLNFQINNTLYEVNLEYRFLEADLSAKRKCQITALEKNQILRKLISICKNGQISFQTFYANFSEDFEKHELYDFFQELISMRFLVSEIELGLTESDDLMRIKAFLNQERLLAHNDAEQYRNAINKIENYIRKIQNLDLGNFLLKEYQDIQLSLRNLGISIDDDQLFQVDLLHRASNKHCFSRKDIKNICESIEVISKLTEVDKGKNELEEFRKIFYEKYETQTIDLLKALDVDIGVGFPANVSIGNNDNEFFNDKIFNETNLSKNKTNISGWLLDKIEGNKENRSIEITKNDLSEISPRIDKLSNTFFVVGHFVENGKILLQNVGGIIGNTLLSRFSYLDENIKEFSDEISNYERNISQDVIFADIIWIENSKVGNISRHVSNLEYEIPILYSSSEKGKYRIDLSDLQVSILNKRVVLTSKKLKKRVIPILSNAHNFKQSSNPIYKFLCALQYQNKLSFEIRFDFEKLKKRHFPRIFYKNIILSPAQWIIQKRDAKEILNSDLPLETLKNFLNKWNFARFVSIAQGDNELFIDTDNHSFLGILLNEIKSDQILVLKEWIQGTERNNANFTTQFILPLRKKKLNQLQPIAHNDISKLAQRTYFPGEDWVYFKIYCSTNFSNTVLQKIYRNYILDLKKNHLIEKWFFIRYADPHSHLRLRMKKTNHNSFFDFYSELKEELESFQENGIIWRIKTDTYRRELERYGVNNINEAESIFCFDSERYLKNLNKRNLEEIDSKICLAVQNVNLYFLSLKMSNEEKMYFCEKMKLSLAKEKNTTFLKAAENKFREFKTKIFDYLDNNNSFQTGLGDSLKHENLHSYIHMSVNRWFESNQRDWEYFLYVLLYEYNKQKFYKSK